MIFLPPYFIKPNRERIVYRSFFLPPWLYLCLPCVFQAHEAWRHEGSGRTWRSESHHQRTYSCVVSPGCTLSTHEEHGMGFHDQCTSCSVHVITDSWILDSVVLWERLMRLTITSNNVNIHINPDEVSEHLERNQGFYMKNVEVLNSKCHSRSKSDQSLSLSLGLFIPRKRSLLCCKHFLLMLL